MKVKQKNKMKRVIALVLCFAMVLSGNMMNAFAADLGENGLRGDYYLLNSSDLSYGEYKGTYIDANIASTDMEATIKTRTGTANYVAVCWTGRIVAPADGDYIFHCYSDNGARLWIDGELVIDQWQSTSYKQDWTSEAITMAANEAHDFKFEWFEYTGGSQVTLSWESDSMTKQTIPESAFYLPEGFGLASVDALDDSNAQLNKNLDDFGGTIKLTGSHLDTVDQVEIVTYGGESLSEQVYAEITSQSETALSFAVPETLEAGIYKMKLGADGVVTPVDISFVVVDPSSDTVSRTEHPRPDWEREQWMNLNGWWDFSFDSSEVGKSEKWYNGTKEFDYQINVPYPWESELSGIGATDYRGQAWYQREIELDETWLSDSVFINFGAVDAKCTVYVNGTEVGSHDGGYTDFEFDITEYVNKGSNTVTVWVEDKAVYGDDSYTALIGKQGEEAPCGYTHTGGIWQTVYLESRSATYLDYAHANPDVDASTVTYDLSIQSDSAQKVTVSYDFVSKLWDEEKSKDVETGSSFSGSQTVGLAAGENEITLDAIEIADVKLWDDVTPNLYYGTLTVTDASGNVLDEVNTYFGMREVSTESYDDREYRYIYVNGKPVFLSGLLDQGFWEEGIYTAPSEEALKSDVLDMKELGFSMIRKHLKIEDPLQYYWADKLGMFIWQDMPHATTMNADATGDETPGRDLYEQTLADMLSRDYNHPSVIAIMLFNETWGIDQPGNEAADGMTTQEWQIYLYDYTKELNPNLLVEDMSPAKYDHIQPTDLNTFHMYPKGYLTTKNLVNSIYYSTYPGSNQNFLSGYTQDGDPWLNSEYGGVSVSNGDKDVSWCFKYMTDIQRQYEMLNGFVYTEPYDIEYERNGILTYDRREKVFGYDEIAYGGDMTFSHLTQANYVGIDVDPAKVMDPGTEYSADAVAVNWSGDTFENAVLKWRFDATDIYGNYITTGSSGEFEIEYPAYTAERETISFTLPNQKCVGTITVWIEEDGELIAKNFVNVIVTDGKNSASVEYLDGDSVVLRSIADTATASGTDTLDYSYEVPSEFSLSDLTDLRIIAEVSSLKEATVNNGIENADSSQTTVGSERPSDLTIWINGVEVDTVYIPDNPRDIRGTLTLAEDYNSGASATNFGYLVNVRVPEDKVDAVKAAIEADGEITVSYGVKEGAENSNGLRVYADTTGRYAVSPTVILNPTDMEVTDSSATPSFGNYTAQATLQDGGVLSVRGGLYEVKLSNGTVSLNGEEASVGTGEHLVAVKLFDDHIQVYVDNDPVPVIDLYDYSDYTDNTVAVTKGSDLVIAPETYAVVDDLAVASLTAEKASPQIVGSKITLNTEVTGGSGYYTYRYYVVDENNQTTVIRDYSSDSSCTWKAETAGTVKIYVDVKDSDGTVVTESMTYEVTAFKVTKATLKLENDITVVFKAPATLDEVYSDCYVEVVQKVEGGETEPQTITGVKSADGEYYVFEYTGVDAAEVGDTLNVTIYGYDSEKNLVQGETLEGYSVKQYCISQLSKTSEELTAMGMSDAKQSAFRTLLVDLLNYASEAQNYFDYNADTLVNADLTDEQKAYASSDDVLTDLQTITNPKYVEISEPSAKWKSAGLNLLSKTTVRVKFAYSGDISEVVMTAKIDGGEAVQITEFEEVGDGIYDAFFDGFTAYQFGLPIDFTLEVDGVAISNTLRYSVESYAAKYMNDEVIGDVVSAMMKYGKAAVAYSEAK